MSSPRHSTPSGRNGFRNMFPPPSPAEYEDSVINIAHLGDSMFPGNSHFANMGPLDDSPVNTSETPIHIDMSSVPLGLRNGITPLAQGSSSNFNNFNNSNNTHNESGNNKITSAATTPTTATTTSPSSCKEVKRNDRSPSFYIPIDERPSGIDGDGGYYSSDAQTGSRFLHGVKPEWGWDYMMTFVMPKSLAERLNKNNEAQTNGMNDDNGDDNVGQDDDDANYSIEPTMLPAASESSEDILATFSSGSTTASLEARKSVEQTRQRADVLARLKSAGFVISQLLVPSDSIILVRFSLPEQKLKRKAVHMGLRLKLTKKYGGGFFDYTPEKEHAFVNQAKRDAWKCFFSPADRTRIIIGVLQSKEHWGCDLDVERLVYQQVVFQAFSLHSITERDDLVKKIVWRKPWGSTSKAPLEQLKDYLGARVAFYFVFLSFYGKNSLALSIVCIPAYIAYRVVVNVKWVCAVLWIFAACVVLWTTYFLENWKRQSASICQQWGHSNYKKETVDDTRAQFVGEMRVGFYCEGGFVPLGDLLEGAVMDDMHVIDAASDVADAARRSRSRESGDGGNEYDIADTTRKDQKIKPRRGKSTAVDSGRRSMNNIDNLKDQRVAESDGKKMEQADENLLMSPGSAKLKKKETLRAVDLPRNPWEDPRVMRNARFQSCAVTTLFVLIMGGLTFILLWFRTEISDYFGNMFNNDSFGRFMPGVLNGILITIFDPIWRSVSMNLTRRENHRTNQHFENSLIYKRFAFQFVSNYISLFYIAFLRPFADRKCIAGLIMPTDAGSKILCMQELEQQLMSLVITRATVGQVSELVVPFVMSSIKRLRARMRSGDEPSNEPTTPQTTTEDDNGLKRKRGSDEHVDVEQGGGAIPINRNDNIVIGAGTGAEAETGRKPLQNLVSNSNNRYVKESNLAVYDSTLDDYNELVIQFGYVCLFGVVFPPACAIALLNNYIEFRTDAFKILRLCQRPAADDAADIGAWYVILELLNVISVVTNVAILIFTADSLTVLFQLDVQITDHWYRILLRVVAFFVIEHFLLGLKALVAVGIPDVPSRTKRAIARQQFDIARFFNVGWQNAFRGVSLLKVDNKEIDLCCKYAEVFDKVSDDER